MSPLFLKKNGWRCSPNRSPLKGSIFCERSFESQTSPFLRKVVLSAVVGVAVVVVTLKIGSFPLFWKEGNLRLLECQEMSG